MEVGDQLHASTVLPPAMWPLIPTHMKLGGPLDTVAEIKIPISAGFELEIDTCTFNYGNC
jgi:hypothetical protein